MGLMCVHVCCHGHCRAADYYVPRLIRSDAGVKFTGVVHEVIGPHAPIRLTPKAKIIVNATAVNREHSKRRWLRDEKLLEQEHERDPCVRVGAVAGQSTAAPRSSPL